jgi:hypothetical protein
MLKPTRKLVAGGLLALTLVAVSLLAGGVSIWTPAAFAQGTIPPPPGSNDQGNEQDNDQNDDSDSQDDSNGASSQENTQDSMSSSANQDQSAEQDILARASSPENPLPYSDQWMTIQPGEWQWFAFKYSYDSSRNSDDDKSNDQVPANLRLDAEPANGVSLILVNRDQVQAWQDGEKLEGFGAATPQTDKVQNKADLDRFCHAYPDDPVCTGGDRAQSACENITPGARNPSQCKFRTTESRGYSNWKGTIGATGTYYVVVRGDPRASGPIQYKFTFTGEGLTMK